MLRGITKHPLNLRDSSRTLLYMKTPKRGEFYNGPKMP